MNILELDSYNLADAVKFNQRLNPRLWDNNEQLRPEVHDHLLQIADDFREFLGVSGYDLKDITISGSNAAYTYTPNSDIDLHLVVDLPEADNSEVYRELFDAKKFQYNQQHNITIGSHPVELYVQDANKTHVSQGIYSVLNNQWIDVPKRRDAGVDDISTRSKYEDLAARIDSAVASGDHDDMAKLMSKIKAMRQAGLNQHGEFGADNLAFKMLRNQGAIKRLIDARNAARDRELSLREREIVVKRPFTYGFKTEDVSSNPSGVSPETKMFLSEKPAASVVDIVSSFIDYCVEQLGIEQPPQVKFKKDPQWSARNKTFGRYNSDHNLLEVSLAGRHVMDILRTVAHELTHTRQHEIETVPDTAGATGSRWENQANAQAGVLMRDYAEQHPEFFNDDGLEEGIRDKLATAALAACVAGSPGCATTTPINTGADAVKAAVRASQLTRAGLEHGAKQELKNVLRRGANANESSGYIPTKKQARDPRFSMALTKDVQPGATGREANKLNLRTDTQGKPALLMKTANLREDRMQRQRTDPTYNVAEDDLSEVDRRAALKALGAGAMAAAVPGVAKAGPFVDVAALGNTNPDQFNKVWVPRYKELTTRCQDILRQLIAAAGPKWAPLLKGTTIRVVSSENYAQASAISRTITIDLSVFWDAPDAALAFTIAHELGHIALEHATGTDDASADYKTQVRVAAQYRQGELDADEFAVRLCKTLGYNKAEVFKFIAKNEAELQLLDVLTQSPTSSHPSQKTRIERARMNGFQLSRGGIEQMNVLKQHLAEDDTEHRDIVNRLSRELKLYEDQDLFEINMSPTNLKKLAAQTGAMAGMEFEMIVPGADGGDDAADMEPDYDADENVMSIEDAAQFFFDGDFNGRRDIQRLRDSMSEDYQTWLGDAWMEYFETYKNTIVFRYGKENWSEADIAEILGLDEAAAEALENRGASPEDYMDAAEKVIEDGLDPWLNDAQEDAQEDYYNDDHEEDWLRSEGIRSMSDVSSQYDISWPYWSTPGSEGASIEEVADEFREAIGRKVNWSANYHGGRREPDAYVVEPDGSLEPDDSNDSGLEFVSPPLPVDDMISDLNKVRAWAKQRGCYTNDSTGLHINVSVPGFDNDKLDYVKLALLLGDQYVLDQFGRTGNTYAKSAMGMIKERIAQRPEDAAAMLQKMKTGLGELATKVIHSGTTSKYTSINTKTGYIEFRSPGGDWLNENFDKIETTLLRFVVALDAAMDPAKYRDEYLKKLYTVLKPKDQNDTLSYFAKFAAGELPKAALKSFIKQAQLERNKVKDTYAELTPGQSNYKIYQISDGRTVGTFYAADQAQANAEFTDWLMSPEAGGRDDFRYAPIDTPIQGPVATTPVPGVIDIEPDVEQNFVPGSTLDLQRQRQQAAQQSAASGTFRGTWAIKDSQGNTLHTFSGIGNSQADANRVAAGWLARAGYQDGLEVAVVPVMEPQ
jgi:hypothetical protein